MSTSAAAVEPLQPPSSRSTGPKTLSGKATVARNALRHGMSATKALLKGEEAVFSELMERLATEFEPVGVVEQVLVERLAQTVLRCQRADQYIKGALENEDSEVLGVGTAFYRDANKADALTKALRHLASSERSILVLSHELGRLKHARATGQPVAVPALDVIVTAPETGEDHDG